MPKLTDALVEPNDCINDKGERGSRELVSALSVRILCRSKSERNDEQTVSVKESCEESNEAEASVKTSDAAADEASGESYDL